MTIIPALDQAYWENPSFRCGVLEGWAAGGKRGAVDGPADGWGGETEDFGNTDGAGLKGGRLEGPGPARLFWLPGSLPLGIAVRVCERLEKKAVMVRNSAEMLREMGIVWQWAKEQAGTGLEWVDGDEQTAEKGDKGAATESEMAAYGRAALSSGMSGRNSRQIGYESGKQARFLADKLRGRQLLEAEVAGVWDEAAGKELLSGLQLASLLGGVRLVTGVAPIGETGMLGRRGKRRAEWRCRRCGSGEKGEASGAGLRRSPCASCGRMRCAYCESCLTMGRSRECGLLAVGAPSASRLVFPYPAAHYLSGWGLSAPQRDAAEAALAHLLGGGANGQQPHGILQRLLPGRKSPSQPAFLLWAVTGAGKTEMIFPLLRAVLSAGGRAAVAAPRRDVVLELAPRLSKAFPGVSLAVLYGGSPDRFGTGALTLATTHQLIRFKEAFDLVVIDEVDAFPYHHDPMLYHAGEQARAAGGTTVLLSATPPRPMQRAARRRRLPHARVSVRHHRRPLPVPRRLSVGPVSRWAAGKRIPAKLLSAVQRSLKRGAQVFLFVPYIRQVEPLVRCLRGNSAGLGLDPLSIDGTSSQDPDRGGKVARFRGRDIRLLVSTTILERGVTIPKSDVFVLDADKPLFDAASLVQMSGRAGRSADDPDGSVYFAAPAWTASQREACRQIREMNAYARKKGYLVT